MDNKDVLKKLKRKEFYLNKITAKKIDKVPSDAKININQHTSCKIMKNSDGNLFIKVITKTFIKPAALFSADIEYIMKFESEEGITDKEIEDNINEIVMPLGGMNSYIIASITKEMLGTHLILPPIIKVSEVNGINE